MEIFKRLVNRFWPSGVLVSLGFVLIIHIGIGFVYWQQGSKQEDLNEQINKTSIVVFRPLPSAEKLQAEYDEINRSLSSLAVPAALEIIVGIARENGIDVDPAGGKFNIPAPGSPVNKKIGEGTYQVLSLKQIMVRGDPGNVTAFISDLDEGKTLKTMILNRLEYSQADLEIKAEEIARREEFRNVSLVVMDMMNDNGLSTLPNPVTVAIDNMSAFPDNVTAAADKGYTGLGTPRDGYVLYQHAKISTDNTTQFDTVTYTSEPTTKYYYTSEEDGTVHQFDGPDVTTATEYPNNEGEARRTELYLVSLAVMEMMADSGLSLLPNPVTVATDDMSAFPDNTIQFDIISYIPILTTKYYYTSEEDGTVHQFDGPDVATATEYLNIETITVFDVDIYTKLLEGE